MYDSNIITYHHPYMAHHVPSYSFEISSILWSLILTDKLLNRVTDEIRATGLDFLN